MDPSSAASDSNPSTRCKMAARGNGRCSRDNNPYPRSYSTSDIPSVGFDGKTILAQTFPEEVEKRLRGVDEDPWDADEELNALDIDSTFSCACCYELMVQPTTLNCGHSFCRLCLAQWWRTSHKTTCPQCRQPWTGFPHVNIIIRNTIDKLHPKAIRRRDLSLRSYDNVRLLQEFEEFGEELAKTRTETGLGKQDRLRKGFVWGVLTTLGLVFCFQILFNWNRQDSEMLVYKPLSRWKPADVSHWLSELGSWAAEGYSRHFNISGINGVLLEGLQSEAELEMEPFNINNSLHRQAILRALGRVQRLGGKPPTDLWEFKTLHQGLSTLLSYTVREFPRLTMTGMYMFYYEDIFLPFIHIVCPARAAMAEGTNILVQYNDDIAWEQWVEFIPKFLFFPYYVYAEFAWTFYNVNALPVAFTLANCAFLTMVEAKAVTAFVRRGVRTTFFSLKRQTNTFVVIFFTCLLWPVIPTIATDLMFYVSMYYSPCINFYEVFIQ